MSRNRLAVVIVVCTIATIAAIVLLGLKPWEGTREEAPPVKTYTLTTIISPPGAGSVSPSCGEYESGERIILEVTCPASNYTFHHWSGDASGNSTPIIVTMTQNYSIIANFAPIGLNPLTLVSPWCGAVGLPTRNLGFSWTFGAAADEFYFVLSASPDLSVPVVEVPGLNQTAYMYSGHLTYGTTYYWQVKALSGGAVISESNIEVFRTHEVCDAG